MSHKKESQKKAKRSNFFIQAILGIFDVAISICLALLLTFIYFYTNTSEVTDNKFKMNESSTLYDRSGQHVLYKIFGEENRKIISHDNIPDTIRWTTIAAEDDNFYNHFGIDIKSTLRAARTNIQAEGIEEGASTITQQLARSVFLTREKTFKRKIKEAVLSIKIERLYTKDEILDMYLNKVPYGSNAYGIQAAAQTYFAKDAKDLTLDEAALLSVLPNAPSFYLPYGNNTDELTRKQRKIIKRTYELGMVSENEMLNALLTNTVSKIQPLSRDIEAPHFVMYVLEKMEKEYGRDFLEKGGLKIITSLDWEKQKIAQDIIENSRDHLKKYGADNSSLVAIDPKTGQILAMVGSVDYFDKSIDGQVNVSVRKRQPGSSFKPIVYAKAFEKEFQPETLLYDTQTNFGPDGSGGNYIPQNYDGSFHGRVSMRDALAMSLNIPAVKTLYLAGIPETIELAERLGITTLDDKENYGLALALGGGAMKLLEETAAFSVFANDGLRNPINPILNISSSTDDIYTFSKKEREALNPEIARKINSILSDNDARTPTFGPNNPLHIPGKTVAAKTGTTQDYRDAWTVGYTPSLAVGVWAGNNNNNPMNTGAAGTYVAGPIWNKFMNQILNDKPDENFATYNKVSKDVPMLSGESRVKQKVTYYSIKSGKKISATKAEKKDKEDVRIETEPIESHSLLYYLAENINIDPAMLKRWEDAIHNPPEEEKGE